ncbi:MAG: hypothetical protein J6U59_07780 [Alistipes sp.]|nr:hypothetical protein [Alistipes sp.]
MKRSEELQMQIEELENELEDLGTMSEEDACDRFNVDSKNEAIEFINMELQDAYKALDEAEREEEAEEYAGWCDPAFRTMADFYRMRI